MVLYEYPVPLLQWEDQTERSRVWPQEAGRPALESCLPHISQLTSDKLLYLSNPQFLPLKRKMMMSALEGGWRYNLILKTLPQSQAHSRCFVLPFQ